MSDEETPEEEPSIEEILDSIRQIISDDDEEGAEEAALAEEAPAEEPSPVVEEPTEPEEDVVELTDKVEEAPEPEPKPEPEPEPEPKPEPEIEEKPVEVEMRELEEDSLDSDILTDAAEAATYDGFEKLVRKTAVEHNCITLEEIVRTELKPLLREWLDDNLPTMIERLVQEELERISKSVLDD